MKETHKTKWQNLKNKMLRHPYFPSIAAMIISLGSTAAGVAVACSILEI